MNLQKYKPARSKPLLELAARYPCMNPECNCDDGTTVAAHYSGKGAQGVGKGMSQKPSDMCIAFLCSKCHARFDAMLKAGEARVYWFFKAHVRTLNQLFNDGHILISKRQK